ncbi:hypothetical protein GCM10020216_078610 [Nonomuraea helvata]
MHSPATTPDDISAATRQSAHTTPDDTRVATKQSAHTTPDHIRTATKQSPHTTPGNLPHSRSHASRTNPIAPPETAGTAETAGTDRPASAIAEPPGDTPTPPTARAGSPLADPSGQAQRADLPDQPRGNRWLHYAAVNRQRGMSTAEYAVGTIAACAFAALLFKVVSSPEVQEMLSSLIDRALNTANG